MSPTLKCAAGQVGDAREAALLSHIILLFQEGLGALDTGVKLVNVVISDRGGQMGGRGRTVTGCLSR